MPVRRVLVLTVLLFELRPLPLRDKEGNLK
jgi:hypothetical protein